MARKKRQIAASGFYHVILRGNGKRILFEQDLDRRFFLSLLERYGEKYGIEYHAWCLMDNHVHLLVRDPKGMLSKAMHDIAFVFAQHYNSMYEHTGSVFQRPYASYPIEEDRYLLAALRYIHNNPVRAKISSNLDYPWSSYGDYFANSPLTTTDFIIGLLGGLEMFARFNACPSDQEALKIDILTSGRLSDEDVIELVKDHFESESPSIIASFDRKKRNNRICWLLQLGISVRQIARITGLGRGIIERIKAQHKERESKMPQRGNAPLAHKERESKTCQRGNAPMAKTAHSKKPSRKGNAPKAQARHKHKKKKRSPASKASRKA